MGLKIGFGSTPQGLKRDLEVIPKVDESLYGATKAGYWLQDVYRKVYIIMNKKKINRRRCKNPKLAIFAKNGFFAGNPPNQLKMT